MVDAVDAIKILGGLLGKQGGSSNAGGAILGNLLKGALGGGGSSAGGGANDMLGGLLGMAMKQFGQKAPAQTQANSSQGGGFFKPDFGNTEPEPQIQRQEANNQASVLIKAMINAAKSDGKVDKQEGENIIKQLGDVSQAEMDFVRNEIAQPLDVHKFAHSVPSGLEQNVYAVSLIAIDLDTNKEAKYLHELAQCMNLSPQVCNQIHDKLGAPKIYS